MSNPAEELVATLTEKLLDRLWLTEFSHGGCCCLCGNKGIIDTRGKVSNPTGKDVGAKVFCICPNGRKIKKMVEAGAVLEEDAQCR